MGIGSSLSNPDASDVKGVLISLRRGKAGHALQSLQTVSAGAAATIGNFDGVHRGHQMVLRTLQQAAQQLRCGTCVIGFEPHPREYFTHGTSSLVRLTRLRDKLDILAEHGVGQVIGLRFNDALAKMSAAHFVRELLFERFGLRYLVIGDDFRFGQGREGDYHALLGFAREYGCRVQRADAYCIAGRRVSSTLIREALAANQLTLANSLLGRPFRLSGRVQPGAQQGRRFGYPTANIAFPSDMAVISGVFAAWVHGIDDDNQHPQGRPAVAYCGHSSRILETHVFDLEQDLYGRRLRVELLARLRDDLDFPSRKLLNRQLLVDCLRARALLQLHKEQAGPQQPIR